MSVWPTVGNSDALERALAASSCSAPPDLSVLERATRAAQLEAFDESRFREAWSLTDEADGIGTPPHLVADVRMHLLARLRALVAERAERADALPEGAVRRDAFIALTELGDLFVESIRLDWERTIRLFRPLMQYAHLQIDAGEESHRARLTTA